MKKVLLIISSVLLVSCQSMGEAKKVLSNEKIKTTDEFLVKKRNPLVLPPDFEKIPEPGSISETEEDQDEKIKKILKVPKTDNSTKQNSSSIEDSILNSIRK